MKKLNNVLSIVLGLAILGTIVAFIYVITVLPPKEVFTEFYILGPGGKAIDYPTQLKVDGDGSLILGIVNWEHETTSYRVEIKIEGDIKSELEPVVLEHGEKLERLISFTMEKAGEDQKVEFLLYKEGEVGIYQSLYLWSDVTE